MVFCIDQFIKGMMEGTAELAQSKVGNPGQCAMSECGETCNDNGVQDTTLNSITAERALSELECSDPSTGRPETQQWGGGTGSALGSSVTVFRLHCSLFFWLAHQI